MIVRENVAAFRNVKDDPAEPADHTSSFLQDSAGPGQRQSSEACNLRGLPRRASTTSARSDVSVSCTAQPHRRHSNCHNFRPLPVASSPSRTADSSCGLSGNVGSAAPPVPDRRLRGDEDTSAYTVFVPPARLSPTVVRRREASQAGGEPQRSVSFRLSNFVSRATGGHEKRGSFLHR